jgi:23S rRNA (uracil1939-C5)-methyltransferase
MTPSPVERGQTLVLRVEDLAFGGQGVARVEGFTVFVDQGLPGQEVEAVIVRRRRRFAEARIERVLVPSPLQTEPPCEHFGLCGGCALQHLRAESQLEAKRAHVRDCIVRLGGFPEGTIAVEPVIPSPHPFAYRNKMEFSFGTRWLSGSELASEEIPDRFGLGLHVRRRFDRVVDLGRCHLYPEDGSEIVARVRRIAAQSGLPPYSTRTHTGFWRFLIVRRGERTGERMVHLVTHSAPDGSPEREAVERVAGDLWENGPPLTSLVHGTATHRASVAVSDTVETLRGEPVIRDRILDLTFEIGPNTFFQTNTPGAEILYTQALERGGFTPEETVWDLYSGVGTLSLVLARHVRSVLGIEIVPPSVAAAERNAAANGVTNARFQAGDVRHRLAEAGSPPDAVVVNPPRDGLHPQVTDGIAALGPSRIVYISCNPATLARDLARFAEKGYGADTVQPVDMFPHTPHVECVTAITPRR